MLVLIGERNCSGNVKTKAIEELNQAKADYNNAVKSILNNTNTNDALLVSQIDQTVSIINETIGDETSGLTALKDGAEQISAGINRSLATGFTGIQRQSETGSCERGKSSCQGAEALS